MAGLLWMASCKQENEATGINQRPSLPDQPFDYSIKMPPSFFGGGGVVIDPINIDPGFGGGFFVNPQNPQISNAGATLGRVLFYDPQLSLNNLIACASCHKQELAFSDGVAASTGFAGKTTPRNSMAILNAAFNNNLFWDSRVGSVTDLATRPIQNHIEMGIEEMERLTRKLAKVSYYPALFESSFGDQQITEERIASALAQFVCSITTSNSRFDQEMMNNFTGFTTLEKMGKDLFFSARTNCNRCHAAPNFAAPDFVGGEYGSTFNGQDLKGGANNGLDLAPKDPGLGQGRFRIPSLRNIALTGPYMHDGRFKTLEQVVEHYNSGIQAHPALDKNLRNADGSPLRPDLNGLEKKALVAFMNTLTDQTLLTDPKYSNPFD